MFCKTRVMLTSMFLVAATASLASADTNKNVSPIGAWDLSGIDSDGYKWIATVVIRQERDSRLAGHIDWLANDGTGGREYVNVTFDAESRVLRLVGTKIVFSETIARGTYAAKMSEDGTTLKGSWTSGLDDAVPGNWSATRIAFQR